MQYFSCELRWIPCVSHVFHYFTNFQRDKNCRFTQPFDTTVKSSTVGKLQDVIPKTFVQLRNGSDNLRPSSNSVACRTAFNIQTQLNFVQTVYVTIVGCRVKEWLFFIFVRMTFKVFSLLWWARFKTQGFVWFCLSVYRLHLQDLVTRICRLCFVPSMHTIVTFLVRVSSATQRHARLWLLIILENFGKRWSSSIARHFPSQIMSRNGLLLVQKPFDMYLRIRIPSHTRLRIPKNGKYKNSWMNTSVS